MSYHILHQFDEPWPAATGCAEEAAACGLKSPVKNGFGPFGERRSRLRVVLLGRRVFWFITVSSLVVAACALMLAMEAGRRADHLQERLTILEKQRPEKP